MARGGSQSSAAADAAVRAAAATTITKMFSKEREREKLRALEREFLETNAHRVADQKPNTYRAIRVKTARDCRRGGGLMAFRGEYVARVQKRANVSVR